MLPARDGWGQFNPVLSGDADGGDADGYEVMGLPADGQEGAAGRNAPFQDHVATGIRVSGQHPPGQAAPGQVTDGEGDLGAPEVQAQHYLHPHPHGAAWFGLANFDRKASYPQSRPEI